MLVHEAIPSPASVKNELTLTDTGRARIRRSRRTVEEILEGKDPRLLVVVGPCSIHNTAEGLEYAARLRCLADQLSDELYVVFRAYMEKPRTSVGWKGLINDPYLDESYDVSHGLKTARNFLLEVANMDLPIAAEALDPLISHYLNDLVTWSAIGARTIESQVHRELASGLSSPIGVKNSTDGTFTSGVNAVNAIAASHKFLSIDQTGNVCVTSTNGNPFVHIVLRGGRQGTNYDSKALAQCGELLRQHGLRQNIMVDCSHENSNKDHAKQSAVFRNVLSQITSGNRDVIGLMLESNLLPGTQPMRPKSELSYGISVTDSCIGWDETEALLREAAQELRQFRKTPQRAQVSSVVDGSVLPCP